MITPREMEYLISIKNTKSIVKSALECNVSQPALTMQVNKIEGQFGFKIFNRQRSNTIPTALGRVVIDKCEQIMKQMIDLKNINTQKSEIKIGIIPTVSPYLLPKISHKLTNSKLQIYFYDIKTNEILERLTNGEIDYGIVANYPELIKTTKFMVKNLYKEDFVFVTHKSIDISIEDGIASNNIILLEDGNCINLSIKEICNLHKTKHSFAATSIEVIKAMIANNNGYGILPKFSIDKQNLINYNIKNFKQKTFRDICIITNQGTKIDDAINIFK